MATPESSRRDLDGQVRDWLLHAVKQAAIPLAVTFLSGVAVHYSMLRRLEQEEQATQELRRNYELLRREQHAYRGIDGDGRFTDPRLQLGVRTALREALKRYRTNTELQKRWREIDARWADLYEQNPALQK